MSYQSLGIPLSSAEAHCHTQYLRRVMSSEFTTHAELWGATIYTNGSSRTSLAALTCCPRDRGRWLKAVLCPARAGAPKTGKKRVELKPPRMRNLIEPSQPAANKSTFVSVSFFPNFLAIWEPLINRYLSTFPEEVKCKTGLTNPKFASRKTVFISFNLTRLTCFSESTISTIFVKIGPAVWRS